MHELIERLGKEQRLWKNAAKIIEENWYEFRDEVINCRTHENPAIRYACLWLLHRNENDIDYLIFALDDANSKIRERSERLLKKILKSVSLNQLKKFDTINTKFKFKYLVKLEIKSRNKLTCPKTLYQS